MGRPTDYTPELAGRICERLADGESLRSICRDDDMPGRSTVLEWLARDLGDFRTRHALAREAQADAIFDETLEIADDGSADYVLSGPEGVEVKVDQDHIQRSRLRVETRKWIAAKLAPKKYGERSTVEHTDPDGKNPFVALMEQIAAAGRPRPPGAIAGPDGER